MKFNRLMKAAAAKGISAGTWKPSEHKKFVEGMEIYGRDWKQVSFHVKTRNTAQCRSHAQKYFLKLEKLRDSEEMDSLMSSSTLVRIDEYLNCMSSKCSMAVQYGEDIEFHIS